MKRWRSKKKKMTMKKERRKYILEERRGARCPRTSGKGGREEGGKE